MRTGEPLVGKDDIGNIFYVVNDKLFVDLVLLNVTKLIGKLTYNTKDKTSSLLVERTKEEKSGLGYMISAVPLESMNIDKIMVIEDGNKYYLTEFSKIKQSCLEYYPRNGYEKQFIIADHFWSSPEGKDTNIIVVSG